MISCLMVTQPNRLALAARAIADFAVQTWDERELVVVHDGNHSFTAELETIAARVSAHIRIVSEKPGRSLGTLRNAAVAAARGDFVCQWDDDDRYHRERLALQRTALDAQSADFSFLVDQLHWFPARREMYWDDWSREGHPLDLVQGTLFARRAAMPGYPDLARGEDTALVYEILRRGDRIARIRGAGWCYVYVYHGGNVFCEAHHAAISRAKSLSFASLLNREALLRTKLAEYVPPFGEVRFPHAAGVLDIRSDE
jgi:glycosyltransferase involved in cell wall biosynthesis